MTKKYHNEMLTPRMNELKRDLNVESTLRTLSGRSEEFVKGYLDQE